LQTDNTPGFWAKAEQGSGTAAVSAAMADLQKPLSSLAPKALAAVLTGNPRFNRWMMRDGGPRTGSSGGYNGAVIGVGWVDG